MAGHDVGDAPGGLRQGDGLAVAGTVHGRGRRRRDQSRPPGMAPLPEAVVEDVVASTLGEPPGETNHWGGRAMAEAVGIRLRSVQRIWAAHGLQPHRIERLELATEPEFAAKPFVWTADPDILRKVNRRTQALASVH